MTTTFVLSGGASLGAVQVGMLQALAERNIRPDFLVGTSAGAVNAAYVAGYGMDRPRSTGWPIRGGGCVARPRSPFSRAASCSLWRAHGATARWIDEGGPLFPNPERFLSLHDHTHPLPGKQSVNV